MEVVVNGLLVKLNKQNKKDKQNIKIKLILFFNKLLYCDF